MLCAVYCRLSREDADKRNESESIQNQKSMLIKYAIEKHWDIYKIYCDEDYSGIDSERPDFRQLINDARKRKFDIVLCKTQSRFTRDMELVERYIHGEFPLLGIRFVAVAENIDTDIKGNKKARQISGLVNEWYLEDLSENIKMVLDHKRNAGKHIGAFPLYGYKKDPAEKGKLILDDTAAAVVKQIYMWYLDGWGKQRITNKLNELKIENPTKYKQSNGLKYVNGKSKNNSGMWNKNTVSRILSNEMYTGTMVQGKSKKVSYKSKKQISVSENEWIRVEGTHEAIIERDVFTAVQLKVSQYMKNTGGTVP